MAARAQASTGAASPAFPSPWAISGGDAGMGCGGSVLAGRVAGAHTPVQPRLSAIAVAAMPGCGAAIARPLPSSYAPPAQVVSSASCSCARSLSTSSVPRGPSPKAPMVSYPPVLSAPTLDSPRDNMLRIHRFSQEGVVVERAARSASPQRAQPEACGQPEGLQAALEPNLAGIKAGPGWEGPPGSSITRALSDTSCAGATGQRLHEDAPARKLRMQDRAAERRDQDKADVPKRRPRSPQAKLAEWPGRPAAEDDPKPRRPASESLTRSQARNCPAPGLRKFSDGGKLRNFLEKQLVLIRKATDLDADARLQSSLLSTRCAELQGQFLQEAQASQQLGLIQGSLMGDARRAEEAARYPAETARRRAQEVLAPQQAANRIALYRRYICVVHALERLDVQVLGLPQSELRTLVGMGFKLDIAEGVRAKARSLNASSFEGLRGKSSDDEPGSDPLRDGEKGTNTWGSSRDTDFESDAASPFGSSLLLQSTSSPLGHEKHRAHVKTHPS